MSLILDALNRAESERKNQNSVPDIGTLHVPGELTRVSGSNYKWLLTLTAFAIILCLIVTAMWWFGWRETSSTKPTTSNITTVISAESVASQSSVLPQQLQSKSNTSLPETQNQTAAPQLPIQEVTSGVAEADTHSVTNNDINQLYATQETAPVVDANVNDLYAAAESSEGSTAVVDPFAINGNVDSALVAEVEPDVPPRTFASITNIPDFNALPWNMRQSIPTITYLRHNFLANGVSSVVINNQTVGVGNIISIGQFVVQEIYVDGVVLKHGNTQFKLRALNGWINM